MNRIEEQFNRIAKEYDQNRRLFIPCFDDFYHTTTKIILDSAKAPARVLDLGAGTGLLSYFWYEQHPDAEYVLVDIAADMLEVSKQRFEGIDTISHQIFDYTKGLPEGNFDAIISALSIHHLDDDDKEALFHRVYDKLPEGGLFVNYDQFCAGSPILNKWYDSFWEKQLFQSSLTSNDIDLWKERRLLDKECSVESEIEMLRGCNFSIVKCLFSYHKFSVIVAIK